MLYEKIYVFLIQIGYIEKTPTIIGKGLKESLSKHIEFWEYISAHQLAVRDAYVVLFERVLPSMFLENNRSALVNAEFVDKAVSELVEIGYIQVPSQPYVVCLLSTAISQQGNN
jgi:hypothetical protein